MHKDKDENAHHDSHYRARELAALAAYDHQHLDGEMFLQALNGFLLILSCDGEVFFATHSIESYLGFHQSDIVHQSVYELVHSEDREELQRQLMWNSFLPADSSNMPLHEALAPQQAHLLERSFTVRFRCLLDNTSGFLRLDIRGRVKVLHGQNRKTEEPPLALFALCTPFGPPSLLEVPQKEVMFKSKHKLDLGLVSMDQRGKMLLGYSDSELANLGGYDLVHFDDLAYVASAHQELLKTGASGMIAYRYQTKDGGWQWLQTSSRLVYKNSKPDFVISTHRPLMEEEGRDLLGKRTMDFKVSYLDAGLTNSYFSDSDNLSASGTNISTSQISSQPAQQASPQQQQQQSPQPPTQRVNRRYKTQLRDFLSTCRSKRNSKNAQNATNQQTAQLSPLSPVGTPTAPGLGVAPVDYLAPDGGAAAAAVVAAYGGLNSVYPAAAASYAPAAASVADPALASYLGPAATYHHQGLYDNRYLGAAENIFQYRPLGSFYPDYHATAGASAYNGFVDVGGLPPTYESHQQLGTSAGPDSPKFAYGDSRYGVEPSLAVVRAGSRHSLEAASASSNSAGSSPATHHPNGLVGLALKPEEVKHEPYGEAPRQTVLMWGAPPTTPNRSSSSPPPAPSAVAVTRSNGNYSPPVSSGSHLELRLGSSSASRSDPLKSLQEMNAINGDSKWKRTSPNCEPSPPRKGLHLQQQQQQQHQQQQQQQQTHQAQQQHYPVVTSTHYSGYGLSPHQQQAQQHQQQQHQGQQPGGHLSSEPGPETCVIGEHDVLMSQQHHQHHVVVVVGNGAGTAHAAVDASSLQSRPSNGPPEHHPQRQQQQRRQLLLDQQQQQQQQLGSAASFCLTDVKSIAGSPLLSISEVTNTLLNQ
ncbi:DNA N6-methyl adenine demethylase isoform X2 [Trichogramma pretiosum]|uniref:DNA N6-methyl adenine demethylase isoform X2 n=1 Tax=Trichogramma pretiosum TaxID=7493 RepID=UPI000C7190CC|nr:DNA N6-methyl adenine demethylase isoform X2 [Trichogramma pretiosum]